MKPERIIRERMKYLGELHRNYKGWFVLAMLILFSYVVFSI